MTGPEIDDIIDEVDALMDLMLSTGSLGALILQVISRTWSAYRVMLKDPNARRIGEYSENRVTQYKLLWDQVLFFIKRAQGVNVLMENVNI